MTGIYRIVCCSYGDPFVVHTVTMVLQQHTCVVVCPLVACPSFLVHLAAPFSLTRLIAVCWPVDGLFGRQDFLARYFIQRILQNKNGKVSYSTMNTCVTYLLMYTFIVLLIYSFQSIFNQSGRQMNTFENAQRILHHLQKPMLLDYWLCQN